MLMQHLRLVEALRADRTLKRFLAVRVVSGTRVRSLVKEEEREHGGGEIAVGTTVALQLLIFRGRAQQVGENLVAQAGVIGGLELLRDFESVRYLQVRALLRVLRRHVHRSVPRLGRRLVLLLHLAPFVHARFPVVAHQVSLQPLYAAEPSATDRTDLREVGEVSVTQVAELFRLQRGVVRAGCLVALLLHRARRVLVHYAVRVVLVDAKKVFAAQLFVANVAYHAPDLGPVLDLDPVHPLHVRLHEVLIAQLLVAYLAIAGRRGHRGDFPLGRGLAGRIGIGGGGRGGRGVRDGARNRWLVFLGDVFPESVLTDVVFAAERAERGGRDQG